MCVGNPLYLKSPLELLRAHEEAQALAGEPVRVADTLRVARPFVHNSPKREVAPQDVMLYGFERIERLLARLLVKRMGGIERVRLRAIATRACLSTSQGLSLWRSLKA